MDGHKGTMTEFILNPDFDESMFNLDPPTGYKVVNIQTDVSPVAEKDLTETLRRFCEACGVFPDTLNMQAFISEFFKRIPEKDHHKMNDLNPLALRGFGFVVELPPEADAHYAGKGVSLGKADTPIFWYRPKNSREVPGDLRRSIGARGGHAAKRAQGTTGVHSVHSEEIVQRRQEITDRYEVRAVRRAARFWRRRA